MIVIDKNEFIGKRFGMLTVIEYAGKGDHNKTLFRCKCDCGNEKVIPYCRLNNGNTKSCGCLSKKNHERLGNLNKTHGETKTRLYKIWKGMKGRCSNPNRPKYARYGGRGIVVYDGWVNDFDAFKKWAMENGYKDSLTIERINVNGNYDPGNCCWIPLKDQKYNKEKTIYLEYNGKIKPLLRWAEEKGINPRTMYIRRRKGWSDREVIEGR